ncbi:MAG: hypothetical protein IKF19_04190 [Bacilli bacterium]|nr:hypothetical protein [Bacilli bacterium]
MLDIDYYKYLSIDNGKGVLFNREDIDILSLYGFDYMKYSNIRELIFDIDNYLNDTYEELDDLEEVLVRLSEIDYYVNIKK